MESEIEKDFKTILELVARHLVDSGGVNNNAYNALSNLHGQILAAWLNCRPPAGT